MYKIVFIGAGPSNLSSIINLEDKSNILLVEKGKDILKRPKKEVIYGFGGAGAFSDFKLSYGYGVGGYLLDHVTEDTFDKYIAEALTQYQNFTDKKLEWSNPTIYEIPGLEMMTQKVIHVGTAEGYNILTKIFDYLNKSGVEMKFETEVIDIKEIDQGFKLITSTGDEILAQNIVIGTGQKDKLATKYFKELNAVYKQFQLGVRVEVPNNDNRFAEILAANYDFKYFKYYETPNFNIRVRTFCCNSGNAHVAQEQANGIISWNGHAIGDGVQNGKVNFGVICEISSKTSIFTQEKLIETLHYLNQYMNENPYKFNGDFNHVYTNWEEIDNCIQDFLQLFNEKCKLSDGQYYTPEYKNTSPSYDYRGTFNEIEDGIYLNGDIFSTRGIITSSACGILTSNIIENKVNYDLDGRGRVRVLKK